MNKVDLFGDKSSQAWIFFHDESFCRVSDFLYHGFLFIKAGAVAKIIDELINVKKKYKKENRELHFYELNQHSKSQYGAKTQIALEWLDNAKHYLEKERILFYYLGVDLSKIQNFWDNKHSFDKNIYLRFFEIGLKSGIRWFNIDKIDYSFLDNGSHNSDRISKVQWLDFNFFKSGFNHKINTKNISILDSDELISKSFLSNLLQLGDILIGTTRSSFVELGDNQKGQKECVDNFSDIIKRFNNSKTAYIKSSRYYKKFALQFFPHNNLSKKQFLSSAVGDILKRQSNFYCDRLTFHQHEDKMRTQQLF